MASRMTHQEALETVGVEKRHPTQHLGRRIGEMIHILHSQECADAGTIETCAFTKALSTPWRAWPDHDEARVLMTDRGFLFPAQYAASPHVDATCPFCTMFVTGEFKTKVRKRSRGLYIIEPLNPVTEGHLLAIPVLHSDDFVEAGATLVYRDLLADVARFIEDHEIGPCNLITSRGVEATQTVFHTHLHIVPRREGDGLHLPWTGQG